MQPLPVVMPGATPVAPAPDAQATAPAPAPVRATPTAMQPLPVVLPQDAGMVDALRTVAFERMVGRLGVNHPLPVVTPT